MFLVHPQLLNALGWEEVSLCWNGHWDPGIPPGGYCHADGDDAPPGAWLCLLGLFLVVEVVLWLKLGVQFDFSLPKLITNFSCISVVNLTVTGKRFLGCDLAGQVITAVVTRNERSVVSMVVSLLGNKLLVICNRKEKARISKWANLESVLA